MTLRSCIIEVKRDAIDMRKYLNKVAWNEPFVNASDKMKENAEEKM